MQSANYVNNNNPVFSSCRDLLPKAVYKQHESDFQVFENLGFEADGEGEHVWLQIKKTGLNTRDVIAALSKALKVEEKNIGYSGLKDKHAITTQWMSVPVPIASGSPSFEALELQGMEVLQSLRSGKKLRRGAHRSNSFVITLRQINSDQEGIENRLAKVTEYGFPNYFGVQRFGIGGRNIASARNMFSGRRKISRFKRSIYLSAARSWLFNKILSARIEADNWLQVLPGEVCMLDGSNSVFPCQSPDAEIQTRLNDKDIHTTGSMHGLGDSMATDVVRALEEECMQGEEDLCKGLEQAGLKTERRALRALAQELRWQWLEEETLELKFNLHSGVYATSLLAEIVDLQHTEVAA